VPFNYDSDDFDDSLGYRLPLSNPRTAGNAANDIPFSTFFSPNAVKRYVKAPVEIAVNKAAEAGERVFINDFYGNSSTFNDTLNNVIAEGKQQGYSPTGTWNSRVDPQEVQATTAQIKNYLPSLAANKLTLAANKLNSFKDFIINSSNKLNPLNISNPVFTRASGFDPETTTLNPEAAKFLQDFKPRVTNFNPNVFKTYESPFGTSVNTAENKTNNSVDIAFSNNITGFKSPREELQRGNLRPSDLQGYLQAHPLQSSANKYMLGTALEDVPIGSTVTASPIGGSRGARARAYSMYTNKALASAPYRAKEIESFKISPQSWFNVLGQERQFDPGSLKDSMIRAVYNLKNDTDVSHLRSDPLEAFVNARTANFDLPAISTSSPIYRSFEGAKAGLGVNAANLIPTPEAIQDFYRNRPVEGFKNMAGNYISGIPMSAALGGLVATAPETLAPLAGPVGLAFAGVAGLKAVNEISKQQTGRNLVGNLRHSLGTDRPVLNELFPQPHSVMANTPTGVARLTAPTPSPLENFSNTLKKGIRKAGEAFTHPFQGVMSFFK